VVGRAVAGPSETRAAWGTALVDAAPDAIVIADGEGRLVFVNSEAERLFGYARAELLGETVEILVPRRFRERHPAHRRAYYGEPRTRPMGSGLELYGVHRDGTELPVEISLSPIETAGGRLVMAVVRDASERQEQLRRERAARAEAEALARTNAELWRLAEQARLEVEAARRHAEEARGEAEAANRAKDTFLLTLSHELRTPLTPIFLWTGMLRQPDVPREVVARALDGIERGARSQTRLIEDLLDVSSIIAGKLHLELRPLALAEVVEAALEGVRAAAAAKAVVLDTVVAAEALVLGDTQRLGQIVTNLLTNAIKFSDTGGRVTTRLERTGDEVRPRHCTRLPPPRLRALRAGRHFQDAVLWGPRPGAYDRAPTGRAPRRERACRERRPRKGFDLHRHAPRLAGPGHPPAHPRRAYGEGEQPRGATDPGRG